MVKSKVLVLHLLLAALLSSQYNQKACASTSADDDQKSKKILPKDPMYMTDMDAERLFDQWEDSDEEKLPPDELPNYKRPKAQVPASLLEGDMKDPEHLLKLSKKGKTAMTFVTVDGNPTKTETEMLTERWQVGLTNNHLRCERFVIADNRAIFVFEDGSLSFEAIDFLTTQPELKEYSIDNKPYYGKAYIKKKESAKKDKKEGSLRSEL